MESQVNETQKTEVKAEPWKQDFMTMFGFGKKEEAAQEAPSSGEQKSVFQRVWDMWQPPTPRQRVDDVTPKHPTRGSRSEFENIFDKLLQAESGKKHTAKDGKLITSPVGAQGITQIMPTTGKKPGYGIKPLQDDSEGEYLRMGRELLQAYTNDLGGDMRKGLAAYNWGIGNVKKAISKHGDDWESKLPTETKNYLKKIVGSNNAR